MFFLMMGYREKKSVSIMDRNGSDNPPLPSTGATAANDDSNNMDMTDINQMQSMLVDNMSNFVNDETRPILETVQNMNPEYIMPMLANIVQVMPQEQVRSYLVQNIHMQGNELEEIMDQVSHLYVFLNQDKGQGQPGSE